MEYGIHWGTRGGKENIKATSNNLLRDFKMARGEGSIVTKKGTNLLYIRYYVTHDGKRVQKEEATGTIDREMARRILAQRVATERCPPTKKNPARSPAPAAGSSATIELLLMDFETAAQKLSTTAAVVRELIRSGRLKFVSIGDRHLIAQTALEEFVANNQKYYERE
jgi:excisionase family DNA binding protein